MVQLSHPYMTTGKTIALTMQTFVGKMMSLFFNTLSRFVIDFLPRSKYLLISWLQSLSAVVLEPKKIKSVTVFTFPPSMGFRPFLSPFFLPHQHFLVSPSEETLYSDLVSESASEAPKTKDCIT